MIITKSNFELYAAQAYTNPSCLSRREFESDVSRIRYIERLLSRYRKTGDLRARLILNHTVIAYNMFGPRCTAMLLFKIDRSAWPMIAPFIRQLDFMPDVVRDINPVVVTADIHDDPVVADALKQTIKP